MTLICKQYLNQQLGNISFLGLSLAAVSRFLIKGFHWFLETSLITNMLLLFNIQSNHSTLAIFYPFLFSFKPNQNNSSKLKFFGQNKTKIELIDWVLLFASPIAQF